MPINESVHRLGLLSDSSQKDWSVETILSSNEIESSTYGIGPSQVTFSFYFCDLICGKCWKIIAIFLYKIEGEITDILFDRFEHKVLGDPRNFLL